MEDRAYQRNASHWLTGKRRGVVVAPAGSGKTVIAAMALYAVLSTIPRNMVVKIGWMANTIEQVGQAIAALALFPGMEIIGAGLLQDCKVACVAAGNDWSDRDILIVDEAHHCATAETWIAQVQSCSHARWAFTATPPEEVEEYNRFAALFDHAVFRITRAECAHNLAKGHVSLLDDTDPGLAEKIDEHIAREFKRRKLWWQAGVIAKAQEVLNGLKRAQAAAEEIRAAESTLANLEWELWSQVAWQGCIDIGIVGNQSRNLAAIRMAKRHWKQWVLLLVNKVEHGEFFQQRIPNSVLCNSGMGVKKRRKAMDDFRSGAIRCMIATSLADEGLDLPMAEVLIMVSGGRSNIKTEQRTGRVLRKFQDKPHGQIYDFTDRQHPLMEKHSLARTALYQRLNYEVRNEGLSSQLTLTV